MSDPNAMDIDPPAPATEGNPAPPSEPAATSTEPADGLGETTQQQSSEAQSGTAPTTGMIEIDAAPSARTQDVVTEVSSAVPAETAQATSADAMVVDEDTTVQKTTETTTVTEVHASETTTTVVQQEVTTTEAVAVPAASEDTEMNAEPEPTLLEQMVASHTTEPVDSSSVTKVTRAEPSVAVPLNVRPPPRTQPATIARTGYVFDPMMMLHCNDGYVPTGDETLDAVEGGHPEEPMRIRRIFNRLADQGLVKRMTQLAFGQVTMEQILLVHSEDHWNKVQGTETLTDQYIQESKEYYEQLSLYVCRETALCARLSCGGVIQACRSVCQGDVRNAFAIVRPPGHHAEPDEHMGFCFFNNVAVAAREMQKEGLAKKVLILDWDVHHGNGTQRAFWNDPDVLYISLHRHDGGRFYPTSDFGALDMVGQGAGEGKSVNIPWPSGGFGDGDYIYAFQKIVMPIAYEFNPDLVIISAGFDAADGDHLGGCHVTPPAYGHMTHMLCALAGGRVVVALEGGYNLEAISRSALAVGQVLLGETPAELGAIEASEVATEVVHQVALVQSKYWKSIDLKACEPPEVTAATDGAAVIPIPDLLKIHRAHHLFTKHNLFQIPLASADLEEAFGGQVVCNENVYEAGKESVLVVFVHDFGNLRVETDGIATTNVHLTNSYLLETSDKIVDWVTSSGYNLIDVNILAQIPTRPMATGAAVVANKGDKLQAQLIRYVWDNYVELSEAENIVFIGHGTACNTLMDLVNSRDVDQKVKAVVQVAGLHSMIRIDIHNQSRRDWFRQSNRIFVPNTHPVLEDEKAQRRLGGQIFTSEKAKVVDVLVDVFPQIRDFVTSKLPQSTGGQGLSNGHAEVPASTEGTSGEGVNGVNGVQEAEAEGVTGLERDTPAAAITA